MLQNDPVAIAYSVVDRVPYSLEFEMHFMNYVCAYLNASITKSIFTQISNQLIIINILNTNSRGSGNPAPSDGGGCS